LWSKFECALAATIIASRGPCENVGQVKVASEARNSDLGGQRMNHLIFHLLILGIAGGGGTSAMAQSAYAYDRQAPVEPARSLTTHQDSLDAERLAFEMKRFNAAKARARTEYLAAMDRCGVLEFSLMRKCMTQARTARADALALAKMEFAKTPRSEP